MMSQSNDSSDRLLVTRLLDRLATITLMVATGMTLFRGGAGNDTLLGGAGADTITGGFGQDIVHFGTTLSSSVIRQTTRGFDVA